MEACLSRNSLGSILLLTAVSSGVTHAELVPRAGGALMYDTELDVTWLTDANYAYTSGYVDSIDTTYGDGRMSWTQAYEWAQQLVFLGFDDWRLPHALPVNGTSYISDLSFDGSTDISYNITSPNNELAYMFYVNLGNIGYYDTNGNFPQPGYGLKNKGSFQNYFEYYYWSNNVHPSQTFPYSWGFSNIVGGQRHYYQLNEHYAWAVRDGDVVPTGDLVQNGVVDVGDYLVALRILLGVTTPTMAQLFQGDLYPPGNPDGVIDLSDLVLLSKIAISPDSP